MKRAKVNIVSDQLKKKKKKSLKWLNAFIHIKMESGIFYLFLKL